MRIVIPYILAFLAATVPAFAADPPAPDAAVTFSLVKPDAREVGP
jgi:hypothetical protein